MTDRPPRQPKERKEKATGIVSRTYGAYHSQSNSATIVFVGQRKRSVPRPDEEVNDGAD
jgi:hypothetical protein